MSKIRFFTEFNPAIDEWRGGSGHGLYGSMGWCLIGLYIIWPNYFALVLFNRGFGIFNEEVY